MKILLHICCAPSAIVCVDELESMGHEVCGFWFNPNIQPLEEYSKRFDSLKFFADKIGLTVHHMGGYDESFPAGDCNFCYASRLNATAAFAAEKFDAFSTSLLISPYQKHELIMDIAGLAAEKSGVAFFYKDFRPRFREGQARAKELGLYRQKWCGCGAD